LDAEHAIDVLIALPMETVTALEQFNRANDLARRFQHRKAYDMQYLAVAEIARAELVTADRGLRHAADAIGVPARLLR
jgi:predicted nucleic acid-binding protein